jgi:hypothetical protein
MNTILESESPQLVVLNGDLITGENTYYHNSTKYLDIIVAPLVKRRMPWASVYGNHDQNFNLSTAKMLEVEKKYGGLSYTQDMVRDPAAGTSNYYLPVYGAGSDYTPALILWFFDSQGGKAYQQINATGGTVAMPGVVHESVRPLPIPPATPPLPSSLFSSPPPFIHGRGADQMRRQHSGSARPTRRSRGSTARPSPRWRSCTSPCTPWKRSRSRAWTRTRRRASTTTTRWRHRTAAQMAVRVPPSTSCWPCWRPRACSLCSVATIMVMTGACLFLCAAPPCCRRR